MNRAWVTGYLLVAACALNPGTTTTATSIPSDSPAATGPIAVGANTSCWTGQPQEIGNARFQDVTDAAGLLGPLLGMRAHAAAWGDIDGDGWLDLVVGTFAGGSDDIYAVRGATGPAPDRLLLGTDTGFRPVEDFVTEPARTSGAAFADLDNDRDLDLVLSRYPRDRAPTTSAILENRNGTLVEIAESPLPADLAGRSVGVLDFDQDGLLDLLLISDPRGDGWSRLLANRGELAFEDVTANAFVEGVYGLGVGIADLNDDLLPDVFVGGSNRLFIGTGSGLEEAEAAEFTWDRFGPEDDVAGVAIADLNRDGRPDIVIGHHFNSTLDQGREVPVRVYLNKGLDGDQPLFEDVTEQTGLPGLPTKAPHVEIADIDNDGWPDLLTTASAGDLPAIFYHQGLEAEVPRFSTPDGLGSAQYWVTGPTADVDRDGRLDVFLAEWEPALPSRLLLNRGESENWLAVSIDAPGAGVGSQVSVLSPGGSDLIGMREIGVSVGYTAGSSPEAHFGLGEVKVVDVEVVLPGGETWNLAGVAANQHLRLPEGC